MLEQLNLDTFNPDNSIGIDQEDTSSGVPITTPFDPTQIRVSSRQLTIDLLLKRIDHKELNLEPDFQRKGGIWKEETQSRLIESILIRIPLPAFYIDATNDEQWLVVDGLQRLTTLKRFVLERELRLTGLDFLTDFQGKTFDELPRNYQRRIDETQVTVYLIEKGTPPEVKFNIFKRINTGDSPLSGQEIRHALYQGNATKLLARLSNSVEFKKATSNSIPNDRMVDREFVLRFLAFILTSYNDYKAEDFDRFLNSTMENINILPEQRQEELSSQFWHALNVAHEIFGESAFRKQYNLNQTARRYPINKALFETWSVNLARLNNEELQLLIIRKDAVKSKFVTLMSDREFENSISQGTGSINKVRIRFSRIEHLIKEVLS